MKKGSKKSEEELETTNQIRGKKRLEKITEKFLKLLRKESNEEL